MLSLNLSLRRGSKYLRGMMVCICGPSDDLVAMAQRYRIQNAAPESGGSVSPNRTNDPADNGADDATEKRTNNRNDRADCRSRNGSR